MHIHLPLVIEVILFAGIIVFLTVYKLLMRKRLTPLFASLLAHSNQQILKILSITTLISYPLLVTGLFLLEERKAVLLIFLWLLQPTLMAGTILRQPMKSKYYEWARKKQLQVVFVVVVYILALLGVLKFYNFL